MDLSLPPKCTPAYLSAIDLSTVGIYQSIWRTYHHPPPRNFANHRGGASIIPQYTSRTHGLRRSWKGAFWSYALGYDLENSSINSPEVLLETDLRDGRCWETERRGHVAIRLANPILISSVVLDHVPLDSLSPKAAASVPRKISVWILVEDEEVTTAIGPRETSRTPESFRKQKNGPVLLGQFKQVVEISYNVSKGPSEQVFYPNPHLNIKSSVVIFDVEDNHGGELTCLCWIGILGNL